MTDGTRGRFRRGCWAGTLVLAGLVVAHAVYWYAPRPRPAVPAEAALAGWLADPVEDGVGSGVWLPYPHQNLAALQEALGGPGAGERFLERLLRVARGDYRRSAGDDLEMPGFGPFRLPPARELVVMLKEEGEGAAGVLAARLYPTWAWVGRGAGRLAGNPWLAGGEVRVGGRPARVSWDGRLWSVRRRDGGPGSPLPQAAERQPPGLPPELRAALGSEPVLGLVRVGRGMAARGELPPGWLVLRRPPGEAGGLELVSAGGLGRRQVESEDGGAGGGGIRRGFLRRAGVNPAGEAAGGVDLAAEGVVAAWIGGSVHDRSGVVLVFGPREQDLLPPTAVLFQFLPTPGPGAGGEGARESAREVRERLEQRLDRWVREGGPTPRPRPELPQEELPSLLRGELPRGRAGGWAILASDRQALERARALAPQVAVPDGLYRGVWLEVPGARRFVETTAGRLEDIPLVSPRHRRKWRTWADLLEALEGAGVGRVVLESRGGSRSSGSDGPEEAPVWRLAVGDDPSRPAR